MIENDLFIPEGYHFIESIYKDEIYEVIKAERILDHKIVIFKTSGPAGKDIFKISKLSHEYNILKNLAHEGIIKVNNLNSKDKLIFIEEEYFDGQTLKSKILNQPLSLAEFFQLAPQLTDTLLYLHNKGIIHKDINSNNILVSQTGKVKLINFGISTDIVNEEHDMVAPDMIEGNLAYISPEQTGRTSYSITPGSDLYSLGIVFYEMLSGKLPFYSKDPLEIIHFHLSRKPNALSYTDSDIPKGLAHIISDLIEKIPDNRYQSASGLKNDLKQIAQLIFNNESTDDFITRTNDKSGKFRKTQRLYGRDLEIKELTDAYDDLGSSRSILILVSGYSGVGKSAVIKQLQQPVIEKRSLYLSGKFDQFKRNIPYFAFIEAFDELIKNILSQPDDKIAYWKSKILSVLGNNASLIIEVIPSLEHIIGKCPPTIKLQPAEQEYRFRQVLLDFILCFSSPESPLVLVLDDLQWSDLPSLNLLERLLDHPENLPLLIVGAYRDNEVTGSHPLNISIDNIRKAGVNIRNISLQPLDLNHTLQIVADSFGMSMDQASGLGQYVYSKTKGNPFFVNRFLQSLYDNRYVFLDPSGEWSWNQQKIENLDYTDNVIDLMSREISFLPTEAQEILTKASVIGNSFSLATLNYLTHTSPAETYQKLEPALKAGYILHTDKNYRSISLYDQRFNSDFDKQADAFPSHFRFLHDRVQQSAYSMISVNQRKEIHLQTGRGILANSPKDKLNDAIFDITSHYVESLDLVTLPDEKATVTALFVQAGNKAKESTSYDVAVKYFNLAKSLLEADHWTKNYNQTFYIYSELSQSEYLNNNHEGAEKLFEQILIHAKTRLEKFKTYYIHSSLYLKIGNAAKSLQIGRDALKLYNIRFPESPKAIKFAASFELIKYLVLFATKYKNVDKLSTLPESEDPEIIAINYLFIDFASSAYQVNQDLTVLVILRIVKFFIQNGFTGGSNWGINGMATVTYSVLGMSDLGFKLMNLDAKLRDRTDSPFIKAKQDYSANAFGSHWRLPLRQTAEELIPLFRRCLAYGTPSFGAYCLSIHFWKTSSSGIPLPQVLEDTKDHLQYLERTRSGTGLDFTIPRLNMVLALCGKTYAIGNWNNDKYNGENFLKHLSSEGSQTGIAFYYTARLPLYYFFGEYEAGLQWIDRGEGYQPYLLGLHCLSEWRFYAGVIIASCYETLPAPGKKKYLKKLKEHIKWYKLWTKGCKENYEQQLYILLAEEKLIEGKSNESIILYEKAIQSAAINLYPQYGAIANERASRIMNRAAIPKQADHYLMDAYALYELWGADGKCQQMAKQRPDLFIGRTRLWGNNAQMNLSNAALDYGSLIKASNSISSTLKLEELIKRLMNVILENAGAERGVLLIPKNQQLHIIAEGKTGIDNILTNLSIPVSNHNQDISEALINYCWRTLEIKSFVNAMNDQVYATDPYVKAHQVKSMICIPLTSKGDKVGLIYLENKLLEGVFSGHNLEVLIMLAGQIGISLDNALMYENLEAKVAARTSELEKQKLLAETERKKSDELLLNILPAEIATELKAKGESEARQFDNVTVVFTDFVNFTSICENLLPNQLVYELNKCFAAFDNIVDKHGLEKIKTIGDAYLAVSGLPRISDDHALKACAAAVDILKWVNDPSNNCLFKIRIGIHSGPVIAGIVGLRKYVYDIWGDTVNTASRFESSSEAGKINLSESSYLLIKDHYSCQNRGRIEAKNKGKINMYFLEVDSLLPYPVI